MNFGLIISNQSMEKMQDFVILIQIASSFMWKQMIFTKILKKVLKQDFDTSKSEIDRPLPKEKIKI